MRPDESPFPCAWWGTGLANVGLEGFRPDIGTYGRYKYSPLPPLPWEMRGDFMWLAAAPEHDHDTIGTEQTAENAQALEALRTESEHLGLRLPEAFVKFMDAPWLHKRIRSNTLCFLDLGPAPIPSPKGEGYLIRFLADSQGCLFWYLYLTPDGSDHAVVSSVDFYGTEAEQWQDEKPDPYAIVFCAESFETFMCRFWLENEIWFAEYEKTPMSEVGLVYIEQYRRNQVQPPIEYGG